MTVKSIRDIEIRDKRLFVRVDFNVPLDESGTIRDDTRIRRAVPTIEFATKAGAKVILASHLGRPKGERKPGMSLEPVAARLGEILGKEPVFVDDCVGEKVLSAAKAMERGDVLLLENLRFHGGETKNDPAFAKRLAEVADVYVNDAFGTAHRAHASTVGITEYVGEKVAGLLLKEELECLERALSDPQRPVVALFGGAKVSDKLGVLRNLVGRIDCILIGGGMANTFLKAKGLDMGASRVEEDMISVAKEILDAAESNDVQILLPVDAITAPKIAEDARATAVYIDAVPEGEMALDIGTRTVSAFVEKIQTAGTIVWNGPMGVFEMKQFKMGTFSISRAVARSQAFTLVGGGDTVRAVHQFGDADRISYISTGGGAFMEFMEGKTLPGVAALQE
ncbi:phosphoglycerate kinase [Thermodesulfobacteriota bacterium]